MFFLGGVSTIFILNFVQPPKNTNQVTTQINSDPVVINTVPENKKIIDQKSITQTNNNQTNIPKITQITPPTPALAKKTDQIFTLTEVARHNNVNDCYLAINNKVYNVSNYIYKDLHPAGNASLAEYCGKVAGPVFSAIHSNRAWDLLSAYFIGKY